MLDLQHIYYARPTFVYSDGMLPWQCVEESIILYKNIGVQ